MSSALHYHELEVTEIVVHAAEEGTQAEHRYVLLTLIRRHTHKHRHTHTHIHTQAENRHLQLSRIRPGAGGDSYVLLTLDTLDTCCSHLHTHTHTHTHLGNCARGVDGGILGVVEPVGDKVHAYGQVEHDGDHEHVAGFRFMV